MNNQRCQRSRRIYYFTRKSF